MHKIIEGQIQIEISRQDPKTGLIERLDTSNVDAIYRPPYSIDESVCKLVSKWDFKYKKTESLTWMLTRTRAMKALEENDDRAFVTEMSNFCKEIQWVLKRHSCLAQALVEVVCGRDVLEHRHSYEGAAIITDPQYTGGLESLEFGMLDTKSFLFPQTKQQIKGYLKKMPYHLNIEEVNNIDDSPDISKCLFRTCEYHKRFGGGTSGGRPQK